MAESERNSRGKARGDYRGRSNNNWRSNRWRGYRRGQQQGNPSRSSNSGNKDVRDSFQSDTPSSSNELIQRRTQINQHFNPIPCPYKGWKHYFPLDDYVPTSRSVQQIEWAITFFSKNEDLIESSTSIENEGFPLDYSFLIEEKNLQEVWPQLKEDLHTTPSITLAVLSMALYQCLVGIAQNESNKTVNNHLSHLSQKTTMMTADIPYVRVRLINYKKITPLKSLRACHYGNLVAINGTVVRTSNTKPLCQALAFQCRTCSGVMIHHQPDGKYEQPLRCVLEKEGLQCTGNNFEPLRGSSRNIIVEWQSICIQENSSENLEIGRIPRSVDCELMEDLVRSCSPGEVVTVLGIIKVVNVDSGAGSKDKNMYSFYIETVSIQNQARGNMPDTGAQPLCESSSSSTGLLTFSMKDYYAIRKIHEEPNLFAFLVASLVPSIYGNHLVKAGLLLGLFGGNSYAKDSTQSPFTKRPDIHVLIVGDPGLGKSQMLHACSMVSPRGVFVCGNSTTNSGLTVTLTKDGQTNGNEYTLEAGALVLGDQGSCCIDEFDKMSGQHQALLEAMEQQSISLAKSGVVCSLPARTSILAAANPVGGHYNRAKTVSENIKLGPALLSRFDLVFLLLDRPDQDVDKFLTEHILALHARKGSTTLSASSRCKDTSLNNSSQTEEATLKARLLLADNATDLLPAQLLRKYIAYAREYVHPNLSEEAKKEVNQFYQHLRSSQYSMDSTVISLRQLESLIRLSQARAKAELRETVTGQDARDVIELVKTSFDDVFKNEYGALDFSRSGNGAGMSSRNEGKKFIEILQCHADKVGRTLFSLDELKGIATQFGIAQKGTFKQFVDTLNNQGYLLNKGSSTYKLVI